MCTMDFSLPNSDVKAAPRRQCWECLRRRLVCDSAAPVCNKCKAAGVVCPGYDDKKPLKWLAPGTVLSRPRRRAPRKLPIRQTGGPDKEQSAEEARTQVLVKRGAALDNSGIELWSDTCDMVRVISYCKSTPPLPAAGHIKPQWEPFELILVHQTIPIFIQIGQQPS